MKINTQTNINTNLQFKSKIPVKVFARIETQNGTLNRQATIDSNIATILRKYIRVLKGLEKNGKFEEIIKDFKRKVPDNGLDKGETVRFSVKNGIAKLFTGKDAEIKHDMGAHYGRVKSANPDKADLSRDEYKKAVTNKRNMLQAQTFENLFPANTELHIYTEGNAKSKNGQFEYKFSIKDAVFENFTNSAYKKVGAKSNKSNCLKASSAKSNNLQSISQKIEDTKEQKPVQQELF